MSSILVVEDEERLRKLVCAYFKKEGYDVSEAENGIEALIKLKNEDINLIILDVMMPLMDGFETCKKIRKFSNIPIIILTAKSEEDDKLLGYELGADDYVTKPFSPKVLVAKGKALLKRSNLESISKVIKINNLVVNELSHVVKINGQSISLSPKEFDLLIFLAKNKGIVLSRDKLLDRVWGMDYYGELRTVDTHIKRLREKLGSEADLIKTVRGSGYKLEEECK